jgi:hypothetical protein
VHVQARDWFARHAARLDLDGCRVLEIGSLDINGSIRPLFAEAAHYHGLDVVPGPGVDEVADAATWTTTVRYDVVACAEVLEHAPAWAAILEVMWAATASGGTLLMSCATDPRPPHSAVDGQAVRAGEHYANVPAAAVRDVIAGWDTTTWSIEVAAGRGDLYVSAVKVA